MLFPVLDTTTTNNNVVVVGGGSHTTTVIDRNPTNHCLHCVITFFCPCYLIIWIIICIVNGC